MSSRASCLRLGMAVVVVLCMNACTLSPVYQRPPVPVPATYAQEPALAGEPLPQWEEFFQDPVMKRLVGLALEQNRDLAAAMLAIEKTRAQYRIQRADLLPTIHAAASASAQHLPADLHPAGITGVSRQYSATLGFSAFELDLFGRVRSLTEQALETHYAVEAEAAAARISLMAETAALYLQLVADREAHDLTLATVANREKNAALIRQRHAAGIASETDLNQALGLLEEARASLASQAAQVGQDENALALLLGAPLPSDLPDVRRLADVDPLPRVPAGLPSSLLERRPDIRAAEHVLRGANANIGAARAAFFPSISLTGTLGTTSAEYDTLFSHGYRTWSFLPQVSLPIFDTGRNLAGLRVSEVERDIAVARYERSVQAAFREVADALVQLRHIDGQVAALEALAASAEKNHALSSTRYNAGVDGYINVLEAQRTLYTAQIGLTGTRLQREAAALSLYKALGGGWSGSYSGARLPENTRPARTERAGNAPAGHSASA